VTGDTVARALPNNKTDYELFNSLVAIQQAKDPKGTHLYDWWKTWNAAYFNNTLAPIVVSYQNTDYGRNLGFYMYEPIKQIIIQKRTNLPIEAHAEVKRHKAFEGLDQGRYCLALVLLHEMIHQACSEANQDPSHEGQPWADHCNYIGKHLQIGLSYSAMTRQKANVVDDDGSVVRQGGRALRRNVWRPTNDTLLKGTDRLATHQECRHFPWREDAAFIRANTLLDAKNQKPLAPRF
jgi:hypothetical protein